MTWTKPYIIVRIGEDGVAAIVHTNDKLKDVRYWLQYIAMPGDAIFQTPIHPKCAGKSDLTYFAHLKVRGEIEHDEAKWRSQFLSGKTVQLPAAA